MNASPSLIEGLVSVVIPVYNGEDFIAEAIESVLAQDYASFEVIVVDDGSTDRSGAIAGAFPAPVRCLHQANCGLGAARNAGVTNARGEYLAFLDADDLWAPDKLSAQVATLREAPELDGVFGLIDHFQEGEGSRFEVRADETAPGMTATALCVRTPSFLKAGPFWTQRVMGEFVDWYGRAIEAGLRFEMLPQVVIHRRIHGANMTIDGRRSDYLEVVRAALERRRRAGRLDA
ncbi:MAG TPA: glycosyltransferase family A protein [Dehalococcoidia bacterium]|nr:glycosyltransferase family A protein [Dehalococcoidia bacterium]